MSPTKLHHEEKIITGAALKGPRPSPLRINMESRIIQKSSSSTSLTSSSSSSMIVPAPLDRSKQRQRNKQPVIIYMHSPKVIHTQARDFMALVQKLTGFTPPSNDAGDNESKPPSSQQGKANKRNPIGDHKKDSSLVLTYENSGGRGSDGGEDGGGVFPFLAPPRDPLFAEMPLFTPNSGADFYCPPRPAGRCPAEPVYPSPNSGGGGGSSLSPLFESMKGLPEY